MVELGIFELFEVELFVFELSETVEIGLSVAG